VTGIHVNWDVDFKNRIITGRVRLAVKKSSQKTQLLVSKHIRIPFIKINARIEKVNLKICIAHLQYVWQVICNSHQRRQSGLKSGGRGSEFENWGGGY